MDEREQKKPEPWPPAVEEDDEEDVEPESTLPEDVAEREAQRAIEEIESEPERERAGASHEASYAVREGEAPGFLDRAWERQYALEARFNRIGHGRYSRVLKMARKPQHEEFVRASQITAIGIAIIGLLGFLIYLFMQWFMGLLKVT